MTKREWFWLAFWIVVAVDIVFFIGFYAGMNYGR